MKMNVPSNPPIHKIIRFYNLLLRLLGIHIKLLDFHGCFTNKTKMTGKPLKKSLSRLASAIIFIAFVLHYPMLVENIICHLPFEKRKKRIEYFVYYAHFYIKYVVIIVIYFFELLTEKLTIQYHHKIECIFIRLDKMFFQWTLQSNKNLFKSGMSLRETLIQLTILTKWRLFRTITYVSCCIIFNCMKYSFAFRGCEDEHIYDIFCISLPNIFICSYVLHSSTVIDQYTKIYRIHDRMMEVIASDIASRISTKPMHEPPNKHTTNRNNGTNDNKRHLQSAINSLSILIETHDELRHNIGIKLRKYRSVQLYAVCVLYSSIKSNWFHKKYVFFSQ